MQPTLTPLDLQVFTNFQLSRILFKGVDKIKLLSNVKPLKLVNTEYEQYANWSKLNGYDWGQLLIEVPRLAVHCDWSKMRPVDWIQVLLTQPHLAPNCTHWDSFDKYQKRWILEKHPNLVTYFK